MRPRAIKSLLSAVRPARKAPRLTPPQLELLRRLPDSPSDGLRCVGGKKVTAKKLVALGLAKQVGHDGGLRFDAPREYFVRTLYGAALVVEWPAWLHLSGWEGYTTQAVSVVGETSERYQITPAGSEYVKLRGASRWLRPGDTALVPKHAVTRRPT